MIFHHYSKVRVAMAEDKAHSTFPKSASEDVPIRNGYFLKQCLAELDWKTLVL